jgi:hypothetical protein
MRELVERLISAGQWKDADPDILLVVHPGYDVPRLAFLLKAAGRGAGKNSVTSRKTAVISPRTWWVGAVPACSSPRTR